LYLRAVLSLGSQEHNQLSQIRMNRPFWKWNPTQHKQEDIKTIGDCCFNHLIGLLRKDGIEISIVDYEKLHYDSLLSLEFFNFSKHNYI
jgi:hypothetical protein